MRRLRVPQSSPRIQPQKYTTIFSQHIETGAAAMLKQLRSLCQQHSTTKKALSVRTEIDGINTLISLDNLIHYLINYFFQV